MGKEKGSTTWIELLISPIFFDIFKKRLDLYFIGLKKKYEFYFNAWIVS